MHCAPGGQAEMPLSKPVSSKRLWGQLLDHEEIKASTHRTAAPNTNTPDAVSPLSSLFRRSPTIRRGQIMARIGLSTQIPGNGGFGVRVRSGYPLCGESRSEWDRSVAAADHGNRAKNGRQTNNASARRRSAQSRSHPATSDGSRARRVSI